MASRLSTRNARLIRAGILSRCYPYVTGGEPNDGYYTILDWVRLDLYYREWRMWRHTRLAQRAAERTKRFSLTFQAPEFPDIRPVSGFYEN